MQKVFIIGLIIAILSGVAVFFTVSNSKKEAEPEQSDSAIAVSNKEKLPKPELEPGTEDYPFRVYVQKQLQKRFQELDPAIVYAENFENASIEYKKTASIVWDNFIPFNVFRDGSAEYKEFHSYGEAVAYASQEEKSMIYFRRDNARIWSNMEPLPSSYQIEGVKQISQLPELPRGCEVTSLTMLMRYKGVYVDKMELAEKIAKDPTERVVIEGVTFAGNPNTGFVGDMTNIKNFGFGVYNGPIYDLLRKYKPSSAMNLTGCNFDDLFGLVARDCPIWVIVNTKYNKIPIEDFIIWNTPIGEIDVTYYEHSVLVTGYDEENIYFNDPLGKASSAPRSEFISAWEQMGRQAVTLSDY